MNGHLQELKCGGRPMNKKELEQELKKYEDLVNTILEFGIGVDECPLDFGYKENSIQDKAQNVFYEDDEEYCENNCNEYYKKCWLKYFEEVQRLKENI